MDHYRKLAELLETDGQALRLTCLEGAHLGQSALMDRAGQLICTPELRAFWEDWTARCLPETGETAAREGVLCERLYRARRMVICGGGHISLPLTQLGQMLGYAVTVLDDRAEFADPARFPCAAEVLCGPFDQLLGETLDLCAGDSFVVVTRGHEADERCLAAILARVRPAYVGMIGSKTKNAAVFQRLRARGIAEEALSRVHAPIGLAIGAQTPEEIAVAIAAEWIAERPNSGNAVLSGEMLRRLRAGDGRVMATIIRKAGSAPRGVGARMLFFADGRFTGTVGGGAAEGAVIDLARQMLASPKVMVRSFSLNGSAAAELGMICGGEIDVLFEPVS